MRVMSLPEGKDADEYFLIREHEFQETYAANTEDYLPWLAARKMEGRKSQSEILSVISEISDIMAWCQNSITVDMYLSEFTKKYKYGSAWKAELIKARNQKTRKEAKVSGSDDMLGQYGFYIKNSCYYSSGDKRWSNFILKPVLHIRDEKNARRIFQMCNELSGFWGIVEALVSSFKIWNEVDYKIKLGTGQEMKITKGRPIILQTGRRYLFLKYNRVASLYLQAAKASGGHCIPKDSLRFYLEMTPEFRGTTPNFRFRMIENQQGYMSSNGGKTTPTSAMVFDYDTIVEKYGINIDIVDGQDDDREDGAGSGTPLNPQPEGIPRIPGLDDMPEDL